MWEYITQKSIISGDFEIQNFKINYYLYQGQNKKAIFLDLSSVDSNSIGFLYFLSKCFSITLSHLFIDKKIVTDELKNIVENQRIHVLLNSKDIMRYKVGSQKFFVSQGISALEPLSIIGSFKVEMTPNYLKLFDLLG